MNKDKINKFDGEYAFLSNFYICEVKYEGIKYTNTESAFQSAKTIDIEQRKEFSTLNPSQAKRKGRKVKLREDWEDVKFNIMYKICLDKFTRNENLKKKILATEDLYLEEGNTWGDQIWGTVDGVGDNNLGDILMDIREELIDLEE